MERQNHSFIHSWHRVINEFHKDKIGKNWQGWMYDAKDIADEVPRSSNLFGLERKGELPKIHQQCSHSLPEPVIDNHLSCCLGVECRKCEMLMALDKAAMEPEQIDEIKAWTCIAHILTEKGKREFIDTSEGYILTTDDKMYWETVYSHLMLPPATAAEGE